MASVALVLLLLGTAALVSYVASGVQDTIRRNIGFVVIMQRDSDIDQINMVKRCLASNKGVARYEFHSAESILAQESAAIGDDIAAMTDGNPFTAEFDVRLRPAYATIDSLNTISGLVASFPGVKEVVSDSDVIAGIDTTMRRLSILFSGLGCFMLIVSIALINNTVSLSIYGRRFIIHTMKLVGATASFIRRPFVLAGFSSGTISGVIAASALLAARYYAPQADATLAEMLPWDITCYIAGALPIAGALLCGITAWVAANRYLRASYDEMFLK